MIQSSPFLWTCFQITGDQVRFAFLPFANQKHDDKQRTDETETDKMDRNPPIRNHDFLNQWTKLVSRDAWDIRKVNP